MPNLLHVPLTSIPQSLLRTIDELWTDAFGWQPVPADEEVEVDPTASLFLLRSDDETNILATAVVTPFYVDFTGIRYPVQGILNVVAAVQGQGYGRTIMAAVKEWLISENQTGMGFAKRSVSPFYTRCGYEVERDLVERFREECSESTVRPHPDGDEDIFHTNDYANLIQKILSSPDKLAVVPEFW